MSAMQRLLSERHRIIFGKARASRSEDIVEDVVDV